MKLTIKYVASHTDEGAIHFRASEPLDQSTMFRIGVESVRSIEKHYNDDEVKRKTGISITEQENKTDDLFRFLVFFVGVIIGAVIALLVIKL